MSQSFLRNLSRNLSPDLSQKPFAINATTAESSLQCCAESRWCRAWPVCRSLPRCRSSPGCRSHPCDITTVRQYDSTTVLVYILYIKYTKLQSLQTLQKIPNMNYGIYINNKVNFELFDLFRFRSICFRQFRKCLILTQWFWHCWCVLYNEWLFWISDSDSVSLTVYMKLKNVLFFFNDPEVWIIFVRNI